MAGNQKNFALQLYVDDDGDQWNVRGELAGAATAVDGHAAKDDTKPVWVSQSRRNHVRYVVYQHAATLRTIRPVIYTAAAFAAIAKGDIVAVAVAGVAASANYVAVAKIAEKKAGTRSSPHLADIP